MIPSFRCRWFESSRIWAAGLIVGEICEEPSHWHMIKTLSAWMKERNVPGIYGIDTRQLTKLIRSNGTLLGKIVLDSDQDLPFKDPNLRNLPAVVSIKVRHFKHLLI